MFCDGSNRKVMQRNAGLTFIIKLKPTNLKAIITKLTSQTCFDVNKVNLFSSDPLKND